MIKVKPSKILESLPPYLFSRINEKKLEAYAKKLDVIDLGMGNPDMPTPQHIVERLCDSVRNHPNTHRYPQAKGMPRFRRAASEWMKQRFGAAFNPATEVLALIGSKEAIAHLCMTYLDPGDVALVCDPAYMVHFNGVALARGKIHAMPLTEENDYLPDFGKIPKRALGRAKIMFLNYPNNPTAAVAPKKFLKEAVNFCRRNNILLVYDNAYSEITFDGYVAPSIFQIPGARSTAVEFHSFSKTFNMAGWRVGWGVGDEKLLKPLEKFKSFLDYGVPTFVQLAAACALESSQDVVRRQCEIYQARRDKMVAGLNKIGWPAAAPKATMYLWVRVPERFASMGSLNFCEALIKKTGVALAPGVGFGSCGEGYVRMALVTHINRFHDALLRFKEVIKKGF
ncbi:MAG: LL-diaminopimelate aminotransferase [Endomicrobiia bacterium]|nr:LL-diaminopimelate aminotransferase [Endomicrobiia bacterium]